MPARKTAIVTGAQQGIGAGIVESFLKDGYGVVATSLEASKSLTPTADLVLIDGDISERNTAARSVEAAVNQFGAVDVLVNNAGVFITKAFTEFTVGDFHALISVNLWGFFHMTQLVVGQMLNQKSGSIITISAALADNPISGIDASLPMITKGGLNTVTRHLAIEYAKRNIRFNAIAPGVVDTPLHQDDPKDQLYALQPLGSIARISDIVDAVRYLAGARQVTGEVLHVDGGAHTGRW